MSILCYYWDSSSLIITKLKFYKMETSSISIETIVGTIFLGSMILFDVFFWFWGNPNHESNSFSDDEENLENENS